MTGYIRLFEWVVKMVILKLSNAPNCSPNFGIKKVSGLWIFRLGSFSDNKIADYNRR